MNHNGCWNSERKDGYYVMVRRYNDDGTYTMEPQYIKDVSSRDCRYDQREADKLCPGCEK